MNDHLNIHDLYYRESGGELQLHLPRELSATPETPLATGIIQFTHASYSLISGTVEYSRYCRFNSCSHVTTTTLVSHQSSTQLPRMRLKFG